MSPARTYEQDSRNFLKDLSLPDSPLFVRFSTHLDWTGQEKKERIGFRICEMEAVNQVALQRQESGITRNHIVTSGFFATLWTILRSNVIAVFCLTALHSFLIISVTKSCHMKSCKRSSYACGL